MGGLAYNSIEVDVLMKWQFPVEDESEVFPSVLGFKIGLPMSDRLRGGGLKMP